MDAFGSSTSTQPSWLKDHLPTDKGNKEYNDATTIAISCKKVVSAQLDELAKAQNVSRPTLIRLMLANGVESLGGKVDPSLYKAHKYSTRSND